MEQMTKIGGNANFPVLPINDNLIDDNEVYIVQEGTVWCWMGDWGAPEQELYIKILNEHFAINFINLSILNKEMLKIHGILETVTLSNDCTLLIFAKSKLILLESSLSNASAASPAI